MTPTTEAAKRAASDHEAAWAAAIKGEDWPTVHESSVLGCSGCRFIEDLWAEAAAQAAAAERERLRDEVEALPDPLRIRRPTYIDEEGNRRTDYSAPPTTVRSGQVGRAAVLALLAVPDKGEATWTTSGADVTRVTTRSVAIEETEG